MRSHSFLSPKCAVKKSLLQGKGVFAKADIQKNEIVALWGGIIYSAKEVSNLSKKFKHFSTHTVSISEGFYLGPIKMRGYDDAEMFNHSCDPNTGIKGQIVVVARRFVKKGEELCFDYDTTETSAEGWFYCKCRSKNCRGKIDGSGWKNIEFRKKNQGFLSWYIQEKINDR